MPEVNEIEMKLYIYCAGGFGKEVMDMARRKNDATLQWEEILYIDDTITAGIRYGAQVVSLERVIADGSVSQAEFLIAAGEPAVRKKIRKRLEQSNGKLSRLIDGSTVMADTVNISHGVIIAPLCSISSDAVLAGNSCVNTMSIIGHDVVVGENSVVSSMVNLGGRVTVGEDSYIGMGALIKEGVKIGSRTIIGMGSVVYNDIQDDVIALGNPARVVRSNVNQRVFK